jgi:nucleotide-binding universal stress UspA family protein
MVWFKRILVPVDGSELAERAVDVAISMAERFEADIWLLFVRKDAARFDKSAESTADLDAIDRELAGMIQLAQARASERGHTLPKGRLHAEVRAGTPEQAIVEAATDLRIDLIVMGTHGRHGLTDAVFGSTTERVTQETSASVLQVKPLGYPYLRD